MRAVWLVRSRQMAARFRFWLAMFGYNPRDHSLSHKIYLVYAAVFYALWGFMVLTLLADWTGRLLAATGIASPASAASAIALAGLLVWTLSTALSASRRCPIQFTEDDAYLICQTPVNRKSVVLAWLAGQWVLPALIIGAISVTLGFGVVEANSPAGLTTADLPLYLLAGVRIVTLALPVYLGLYAMVWALGVFRLRGDRDVPQLIWLPVALTGFVLIGLLSTGAFSGNAYSSLLGLLTRPPWTTVFLPLTLPLQAGFGQLAWTSGLLVSSLLALTSLALLLWLAGDLNLSRAAMESRSVDSKSSSQRTVNLLPGAESRELKRLGIGRPASVLPGFGGWWSLVWKDLIQSSRLGLVRQVLYALAILLFNLGVLIIVDWGVRTWLALLWVIIIGQASTRRLRADMALWSIYRQLPLPSHRLILGDVVLPVTLVTLLSWLGVLLGLLSGADKALAISIALLAPILAANVTLAAAVDCLRLGNTASLLAGDAPQPGILGALLGAAVVTLAAILIWWARTFGLILAIWLALLTAAMLLRLSAGLLHRMR